MFSESRLFIERYRYVEESDQALRCHAPAAGVSLGQRAWLQGALSGWRRSNKRSAREYWAAEATLISTAPRGFIPPTRLQQERRWLLVSMDRASCPNNRRRRVSPEPDAPPCRATPPLSHWFPHGSWLACGSTVTGRKRSRREAGDPVAQSPRFAEQDQGVYPSILSGKHLSGRDLGRQRAIPSLRDRAA